MRTYLRLILNYSLVLLFLIKVMLNFVLNIELNDNSFELKFNKQFNDNYFEFISYNYNHINNEEFGPQQRHSVKIKKRSKDVSKDFLSTNELMSSSSVNELQLEEDMNQLSIQTNKKLIANQSIDVHPVYSQRTASVFPINCSFVLLGQYQCSLPAVDAETQQPVGCNENNTALVNCTLREGLVCEDTDSPYFQMPIDCRHTNGYSYETALLLSIFLGMFGADRFYLGYPALGLLKFCTLGFLFIGQLIDIILIAMQIVGPADGSYYVIKYFGPKLDIVSYNDKTDIIYNEDNNWYMT